MGRPFPIQNCPFVWGIWTLEPTREFTTQTASRSVQPFLQCSRSWPADRPTDHTIQSVTNGRASTYNAMPHNKKYTHFRGVSPSSFSAPCASVFFVQWLIRPMYLKATASRKTENKTQVADKKRKLKCRWMTDRCYDNLLFTTNGSNNRYNNKKHNWKWLN